MKLAFGALKPFIRVSRLGYEMTGSPTHRPDELTAHEGRIKALSLVIVVTPVIAKSAVILPHSSFRMVLWLIGKH